MQTLPRIPDALGGAGEFVDYLQRQNLNMRIIFPHQWFSLQLKFANIILIHVYVDGQHISIVIKQIHNFHPYKNWYHYDKGSDIMMVKLVNEIKMHKNLVLLLENSCRFIVKQTN